MYTPNEILVGDDQLDTMQLRALLSGLALVTFTGAQVGSGARLSREMASGVQHRALFDHVQHLDKTLVGHGLAHPARYNAYSGATASPVGDMNILGTYSSKDIEDLAGLDAIILTCSSDVD